MKITNSLNLPEPLVAAIRNDGYAKGQCDYSTTELISPPRIAQLKRKWHDHLEEDAADRIWSLLGRSVHTILQHSAGERYLVEERFFIEHDKARIGGQIDLYDKQERKLQDWKVTSRYTTSDGAKPEWIAQGNINCLLMRANDYEVDAIEYVAIYRDWSKIQAIWRSDYPERQVEVLSLPIWPEKQALEYLSERIRVHRAAAEELPLCTPDERWEKPTRWALMKEGQKRAVKLFDTADEAAQARASAKHFVEQRPGESTRCLYYCPVVAYCSFGRSLIQEKEAA